MPDQPNIHVLPSSKGGDVNGVLVSRLEYVLAEAKAGRIDGAFIVTCSSAAKDIGSCWSLGGNGRFMMLGAIENAKIEFMFTEIERRDES